MNCDFHPEAYEELVDAAEAYERCEPGLGLDFLAEVHAAAERTIDHPTAWSAMGGGVRRCQTRRFPYAVLYVPVAAGVYVLAVMHLHRDPVYWRHRRPN